MIPIFILALFLMVLYLAYVVDRQGEKISVLISSVQRLAEFVEYPKPKIVSVDGKPCEEE